MSKNTLLSIEETKNGKELYIPQYTDTETLMWALAYLFISLEEKENKKVTAEEILQAVGKLFGDGYGQKKDVT